MFLTQRLTFPVSSLPYLNREPKLRKNLGPSDFARMSGVLGEGLMRFAPMALMDLELCQGSWSRTGPAGPPLRGREAVLEQAPWRSKAGRQDIRGGAPLGFAAR